jgi:nickel transport system substrate-binding protein
MEGDPHITAVEDEIRRDLAAVGIAVDTLMVDRETYGEMSLRGDFNMIFSKTWGAPYDPHSFATSWRQASNEHYVAFNNLTPPLTRDVLLDKIEAVQKETDNIKIAEGWKEILTDIHDEAFDLPLWGERVPYVVNRRLTGIENITLDRAFLASHHLLLVVVKYWFSFLAIDSSSDQRTGA